MRRLAGLLGPARRRDRGRDLPALARCGGGRTMSFEHDHDHAHVHRSPPRPDQDDTLTYFRAMEAAVRELLIDKGIVTAEDIRRQVEAMDGRNAGRGAKMVARAWVDPAYKERMLADASKAAEEIGL